MNTEIKLQIQRKEWPFDGLFSIARGSRTSVQTIIVSLESAGISGKAECTPYPRYGETVDGVVEQIESVRLALGAGADRSTLQRLLPPGAARNGLDCAFWDLEAKRLGIPAAHLAGKGTLKPVTTAFTISLGSPEKMAADAAKVADRKLLKVKLGADGDKERMQAVREAAPETRLILDANEGWSEDSIAELMEVAATIKADLIEQPLPATADEILGRIDHSVPVCADESLHTRDHLDELKNRYECVNIKLDKTGGLTEALLLQTAARQAGFQIMIGCMAASSLAMAPALLLAQNAEFVDLDGPLLLAQDYQPSLNYHGSLVDPPAPDLWG